MAGPLVVFRSEEKRAPTTGSGVGDGGGSAELREMFVRNKNKVSRLDVLIKNIIDLSPFFFLFLFVFRYLLILTIILNRLDIVLIVIGIGSWIRGLVMLFVYGETLRIGKSKLLLVEFLKRIEKKRNR